MRLGLILGYSGARFGIDMDLVRHAETLGFSSVWTAEAYGSDAVSPAAWVLAQTSHIKVGTGIIQMTARTPATAAMTAMTLQALSNGRFILGVGPSAPRSSKAGTACPTAARSPAPANMSGLSARSWLVRNP